MILVNQIEYNLILCKKCNYLFWNLSKVVGDQGHDEKHWCLDGLKSCLVVNSGDAHVSQFWV